MRKIDIRKLRSSVIDIANEGISSTKSVRRSFSTGVPNISSESGSMDPTVRENLSSQHSSLSRSLSRVGLKTSTGGRISVPPRPELDFVRIGNDPFGGTIDNFYAEVTFSISIDELSQVSFFRILRSSNGKVDVGKPSPSMTMGSVPFGKPAVSLLNDVNRSEEVGVSNRSSDMMKIDSITGQLNVVSSGNVRFPSAPLNGNKPLSPASLVRIDGLDPSVAENVRFALNRRSLTQDTIANTPLSIGRKQGINVLRGSSISSPNVIIEDGNSEGFVEVSRISKESGIDVGSFKEYTFYDQSVVYGSSFTYYVVSSTVRNGIIVDSLRTRFVKANIVRSTPPPVPVVFQRLVGGKPTFITRSPARFLDHIEIFRKGGRLPDEVRAIMPIDGIVADVPAVQLSSGFRHIGDVPFSSDGSAEFSDRNVYDGDSVEYRIYSVDSFGMKSASPYSCSFDIPVGTRCFSARNPAVTAEQGIEGRTVNVIIDCDDPVPNIMVSRRNVSSLESSFRQPSQPDVFVLGARDPKRSRSSFSSPSFDQNSRNSWVGVAGPITGSFLFIDHSVSFDSVYQYAVSIVDGQGNVMDHTLSNVVKVNVKPKVNPPVALTSSISFDTEYSGAVTLSWSPGTDDFNPNELLGDQDALSANSRRSVFQVERRTVGSLSWDIMPATTSTFFVDQISSIENPTFRPPFVAIGSSYDYRVISMQSGGFISTRSEPIRVPVFLPPEAPSELWIRTTPTSIRPFSVIVSWAYDGLSIDGWDVERSVVNKVFGSKVSSVNSSDVLSLPFTTIATVHRESSRSHSLNFPDVVDQSLFVGNRFFMDTAVNMANSYFYRVRSFDDKGNRSDWIYGGINLSDSPFDRKFFSSMTDKEKVFLSLDSRPIEGWESR